MNTGSKAKKYSPTFEGEADNKAPKPHKDQPRDNFATKETLAKTTEKVPAIKAKDLSGSLRETHGPSGATPWESAKGKNPSIRSFAGSKPNAKR